MTKIDVSERSTKPILDPVDLGWLAGIIEGEGSIGPTTQSPRGVRVRVEMTDEDIIRRLRDLTGEGRLSGPHLHAGFKSTWRWDLSDVPGVARILLACYPLFGSRRQAKVAELVDRLAYCVPQPCGTNAAYYAHRKAGETPCDPCFEANRQAQRDNRAKKLPATRDCVDCGDPFPYPGNRTKRCGGRKCLKAVDGRKATVAPCGTDAAYQRHKRNGEDPCDPCRDANLLQQKISRDRKRKASRAE